MLMGSPPKMGVCMAVESPLGGWPASFGASIIEGWIFDLRRGTSLRLRRGRCVRDILAPSGFQVQEQFYEIHGGGFRDFHGD